MENNKLSDVKRHSVSGYGRQDIDYNDPEGEFVYYEDYAALQQKLDAMAAENAALEAAILRAKDELQEHYDTDGVDSQDSEGNFMDACIRLCDAQSTIEKLENIKTPTTDAYLNSVRAEGLKMAIDHMNNQTSDDCADVTVLPVIEMYKKLISGTHDTADKAG